MHRRNRLGLIVSVASVALFLFLINSVRICQAAAAVDDYEEADDEPQPETNGTIDGDAWNPASQQAENRIIGGSNAKQGKWPFMVSIQYQSGHFCGGSILNDDTILTAAHCVKGKHWKPRKIRIYLGHTDLSRHKDPAYLFKVKSWRAHPKFSMRRIVDGHDVAVVKLAGKIRFKKLENVKKICLPENVADTPKVDDCIVMGWGYTKPGSHLPSRLKYVPVPILNDSLCLKKGKWKYKTDTILCAGYVKGKKDACQGDSGGPLICPAAAEPDQWLQYGIVSYGDGCARTFGFYAKVAALVSWIKEQAEGGGSKSGKTKKPPRTTKKSKTAKGRWMTMNSSSTTGRFSSLSLPNN